MGDAGRAGDSNYLARRWLASPPFLWQRLAASHCLLPETPPSAQPLGPTLEKASGTGGSDGTVSCQGDGIFRGQYFSKTSIRFRKNAWAFGAAPSHCSKPQARLSCWETRKLHAIFWVALHEVHFWQTVR